MDDYKMAKERGISASVIKALLAERYGDENKYVCAAEVAPMTSSITRHVDFMAFHCWHSDAYMIDAFEIKISREDLKRELLDPSKHNVFFDEIDNFWIVAPDYVLDKMSDLIPKKWGVVKVVSGEGGKPELKTVKKPLPLHDEQLGLRSISRRFAASMCRAMSRQSLLKTRLLEQQRAMHDEIKKEVEREIANGAKIVPSWKYEDLERCKATLEGLGINRYIWCSGDKESAGKMIREAMGARQNIEDAASSISSTILTLKCARDALKKAMSEVSEKDVSEALGDRGKHDAYAVTMVEYGDSVDGKARVVGVYETKEEACFEMHQAAQKYYEDLGLDRIELKTDSASVGDTGDCGCEYKVEKVEVP